MGTISRAGFALTVCWCLACITGTSAAQSSQVETDERSKEGRTTEEPHLNGVSLGGAYTFHVLSDRDSETTGEPLRTVEHLGGFVLAYERKFLAERLALTVSKPFYFSRERFDTPLDLILRVLFRKGSWEAFVGAVVTWNIRVFKKERAEQEGQKNVMSLGVGAVTGGSYFVTERWSLDLELGYSFVPTDDVVTHEVAAALGGIYHF